MKFNVEIQIDWIDEEQNLDDEVQKQVIQRVVDTVSKHAIESTKVEIEDTVSKKVEELVQQTYDDMMNMELAVTDKYGDVVKTYKGVKELLKNRFDDYLTEHTDKDGRKSTYNSKRRIDWIIYNQLDSLTKDFMKNAVTEVEAKIKSYLDESLKDRIGSEITHLLKIDEILKRNGVKKLKK